MVRLKGHSLKTEVCFKRCL